MNIRKEYFEFIFFLKYSPTEDKTTVIELITKIVTSKYEKIQIKDIGASFLRIKKLHLTAH